MALRPHFIEEPLDPKSQQFRTDCMAWELYTKKTKTERDAFIASQPGLQTEDFRIRLYRCEAWWLLTYLNPHLIEENMLTLPANHQRELRSHLEGMRAEIKLYRQRKHKTIKGNCNA